MRDLISNISDLELDQQVSNVVRHNGNLGYRSVRAQFLAAGTVLPEYRVRESMRRVDPAGVALR